MPHTVNAAFALFLKDTVNLNKNSQTDPARRSRDWLVNQIYHFQSDSEFPVSYSEKDIHFGSFARRTKIRPLDDIDLMICLSAQGGYYLENNGLIELYITEESNLKPFCYDNTNKLNSIKILNKFKSKLSGIPQYSKADLKRNQEAVTLNLSSYEWVFDIVPCFFTEPNYEDRTYYLIPDGKGNWKKTDPRIDKERTTRVNQNNEGYILDIIRIIKYWNKRPTMPSMSSYLLETIILDYYENHAEEVSQFIDAEIPKVLEYIEYALEYEVQDPKGIQGNINHLDYYTIQKIIERANKDRIKANEAWELEVTYRDQKASINKWKEIFGKNEFPDYE